MISSTNKTDRPDITEILEKIIGYNRNKEYSKTTIIFNDKCKLSNKKVSSKHLRFGLVYGA
jgi:hypothetical protein